MCFFWAYICVDNFKLVRKSVLSICLLWGIASAVAAYFLNTAIVGNFYYVFDDFSRFIAPLSEELIKALIIFILVSCRKIGFTVDALIYGFSVGTGFALFENMFYLWNLITTEYFATWIIRGFGTALMHGGATALMAAILMTGIQRNKPFIVSVWPGL